MKKIYFPNIYFVFLAVLLFCLPVKAENCIPEFPYIQGWLGGDAAFSIPLDTNKSLWLFGDTFVGKKDSLTRKGAGMVANSIAISACRGDKFSLDYFWNKMNKELPEPFFKPTEQRIKLWPIHGFVHENHLYVFLEEISPAQHAKNAFGFEITGVRIAEIVNYRESAETWQIKYIPLLKSKTVIPGIAIVKIDDYFYLYSVLEGEKYKDHPIILTRFAAKNIKNPGNNLEYLSLDGTWKQGVKPDDAKIIIAKGSTEISVSFQPRLNKWLVVHGKSEFMSREIVLRLSENPEGPWEQEVYKIAQYKEMEPGLINYDKDTFCYAAKEHPQFSVNTSGELVISYACNSFDFNKVLGNMSLYYPKVVKISFPAK